MVSVISDDEAMMKLTASLEAKSEHPLAKAILRYYKGELEEVSSFRMHIGMGVTGFINGAKIVAGNERLLECENISLKYGDELANGEIGIYTAKDGEVIGKIILSDTLREKAKSTVDDLKSLGIKTTLLTGDGERAGKFISNEVKVSNARFNCLPEDKREYIQKRQEKGNRIAMVGDGINDAPSLKKADVGIAMADIGSEVSIDASNIALVNDNISDLPHLFRISKKTLLTINLNIAFSLALNIIAMILAVFGVLGPIAGALIHNIGSLIVIVFSLTLVNYKASQKLGITKSLNKLTT